MKIWGKKKGEESEKVRQISKENNRKLAEEKEMKLEIKNALINKKGK